VQREPSGWPSNHGMSFVVIVARATYQYFYNGTVIGDRISLSGMPAEDYVV
jgi:hypothetical protein